MGGSFGTTSVAVATTPTVVSTFFAHLFARRKRKAAAKASLTSGGPGGGPEDQLSYEEGLKVVRRFIEFASHRGVEEVQTFTAMQVPTPHWVRRKVVTIPQDSISKAEEILSKHLSSYGPEGSNGGGLKLIGGEKWWRVRGRELEGEWIEMQKDYLKRKATAAQASEKAKADAAVVAENVAASQASQPSSYWSYLPHRKGTVDSGSVKDSSGSNVLGDRVILYIHGGAFFFSSLDTHRYQIQRHARKAGARAFSPAYRLSPQYPFPCGLLDALASYLYLLDPPPDTHAPISPTSIILMGDSAGAGMVLSLLIIIREMGLPMPAGASLISPWVDLTHSMPSIGGWDGGDFIPSTGFHYKPSSTWPPLAGDGISVTMPDGTQRVFDEQVQMYCPNNLLTHPLVTLINQGSLGGLCPLLILGGGGELLRDEIIYLAHKAASPTTYPPSLITLAQYPEQRELIDKYKPTKVHLQIYEGCCHVVPTLSWTRSSKYMYRSCANFNIWAFTAASKALETRLHGHRHSNTSTKSSSRKSTKANVPVPLTAAAPSQLNGDAPISQTPPRSQTLDTVDSMTASPATGPNGSAPDSAIGSRNPSFLDLTKPIINTAAGNAANAEDVDLDDLESEASFDTSSEDGDPEDIGAIEDRETPSLGTVTVQGIEPLSSPSVNIVSERVSTHGKIRPFEPIESIPALDPALKEIIGQVHGGGAIQKWLKKRSEWDEKYSKNLTKFRNIRQKDRELAEKEGYLTRDLHGERPPLCSLVGWYDREYAREVGKSVDEISKKTSGAVMMWMKMSSKADKEHAGGDNLEEIKENVKQDMAEEKADADANAAGSRKDAAAANRRRRSSVVAAIDRRKSSVGVRPPELGGPPRDTTTAPQS